MKNILSAWDNDGHGLHYRSIEGDCDFPDMQAFIDDYHVNTANPPFHWEIDLDETPGNTYVGYANSLEAAKFSCDAVLTKLGFAFYAKQ